MTKICTTTFIARPIEEVYEYITTAANWAAWHPATLSVSGAADHSARPGETIIEQICVGSRQDRVSWEVLEKLAPDYWEIFGKGDSGGTATLIYRLSGKNGGTRFERELEYQMPGLLLQIVDWVFVQFLMRKQSAAALKNLKYVLEKTGVRPVHFTGTSQPAR